MRRRSRPVDPVVVRNAVASRRRTEPWITDRPITDHRAPKWRILPRNFWGNSDRHSQPGKPVQIAFVESLNGKLRDEVADGAATTTPNARTRRLAIELRWRSSPPTPRQRLSLLRAPRCRSSPSSTWELPVRRGPERGEGQAQQRRRPRRTLPISGPVSRDWITTIPAPLAFGGDDLSARVETQSVHQSTVAAMATAASKVLASLS